MPRFEKKVIEQYGRRIARALRVIIRCDEFGKQWNKDNKDCKLCKIDSSEYHSKCREFTKGVGAGNRPKAPKKSKVEKPKKIKKIKYKTNPRVMQPFRRHTRSDIIYRFLKENPMSNMHTITEHVVNHFQCDITVKTIRNTVTNMRRELAKVDCEVIKSYYGAYYIDKTPKGRQYGNSKEGIEFRARELEKKNKES